MASKFVTKKVTFFKIVDSDGDPIAAIPWQDLLEDVRRESIGDAAAELFGSVHYSQVLSHDGSNYLVLAKTPNNPPAQLDLSSGAIIDAATLAARPWVEPSVFYFVTGTNIVGFVRGSMGAPQRSSLEAWLNDREIHDGGVKVVAFQNADILDQIESGTVEARSVRLKLSPEQLGDIDGLPASGDTALYSGTRYLGTQLGQDFNVEITISIVGQARKADPGLLRRLAGYGRDLRGKEVEIAKVELVDFGGDHTEREWLDLTTAAVSRNEKIQIEERDGEAGGSILIPSAIEAIRRATKRLLPYLQE